MVAATVSNEEDYRHQTNLPLTADAPEHASIEGNIPPAALDVIAETCYEGSDQAMGVALDHLNRCQVTPRRAEVLRRLYSPIS